MVSSRLRIALIAALSLGLLSCADKKLSTSPSDKPERTSTTNPVEKPAAPAIKEAPLSSEAVGRLTYEVFERFKTNFPQTSNFQTAPVVIRVEPTRGVEMFEITTPYGIFYTNRDATWMIEGVLMMRQPGVDEAAAAQAKAAGLPVSLVNITLRPDAQERYGLLRDKEVAARATGSANMSVAEIYKAMPREKAITLDYGSPTHEIVVLADILDPASHRLFNALSKEDPSKLNIRLSVFPIGVEEIRPNAIPYAAALLCAGFNPDTPNVPIDGQQVATLWRSFMSDAVALNNPEQAWAPWAETNRVAVPVAETCPRNIEPGVFTRLSNSLGMFGAPIALLPNGKVLANDITLEALMAAISEPTAPTSSP